MKKTDALAYRRLLKMRLTGLMTLAHVLYESGRCGLLDNQQAFSGYRSAEQESQAIRSELYGFHPRDFSVRGLVFRELSRSISPKSAFGTTVERLRVRAPRLANDAEIRAALLSYFSILGGLHKINSREWIITISHWGF